MNSDSEYRKLNVDYGKDVGKKLWRNRWMVAKYGENCISPQTIGNMNYRGRQFQFKSEQKTSLCKSRTRRENNIKKCTLNKQKSRLWMGLISFKTGSNDGHFWWRKQTLGSYKTGRGIWNTNLQEQTVQLTVIFHIFVKKIIYGLTGPIMCAIYFTCAVYLLYRKLADSAWPAARIFTYFTLYGPCIIL